jgi:hypothetical protein
MQRVMILVGIAVLATGLAAPARAQGLCDQGQCASMQEDWACWDITTECLERPGSIGAPLFGQTTHQPQTISCNACAALVPQSGLQICSTSSTGFQFCFAITAGAKFTTQAIVCGVGGSGELSFSSQAQWCWSSMQSQQVCMQCDCIPGYIRICTLLTTTTPFQVTVSKEVYLKVTMTWDPSGYCPGEPLQDTLCVIGFCGEETKTIQGEEKSLAQTVADTPCPASNWSANEVKLHPTPLIDLLYP